VRMVAPVVAYVGNTTTFGLSATRPVNDQPS
jgi:hypothetical protein